MSRLPERRPGQPPEFNPNRQRYWDPRDLEGELRRTFQICHECRMCVTYCGAFPILFEGIDRAVDRGSAEGAETVGPEVIRSVSDHCWQCKLCYIKCPYTEDEGSYELLDFPRLMAREKAQRVRRDGVALVDRVLGEPQLLGALGSGVGAELANLVGAQRLVRKVAEVATGISAEFPLPLMAREPFDRWFERHEPLAEAGEAGEVALFPTCYGQYHYPEVPRAAVRVLEKNGYRVRVPERLTCCGMPNLDGGDVESARAKMQRNVEALLPDVAAGIPLVVPGPTCGYTMKKEWPVYLETDAARQVSTATVDLMEFLDGLRKRKTLNEDFMTPLGKVAYHAACHLRAQKIAVPGARVLSRVPDTEVRIVERCSAVDGTWGMKAAYYEEGARYGRRLAKELEDADTIIGDCSLAALRVRKENRRVMRHPAVALAEAYDLSIE